MTTTPLRRWLCAASAVAVASGTTLLATTPAAADEAESTGPKNIIILIGDGMGYNHVDAASLYQYGTTNYQIRTDANGQIRTLPGTPSQVYQDFDVQVGMTNYSNSGRAGYDPEAAWANTSWISTGATDSAAAGTALATGVKTDNGILGLDSDGNFLKNAAERATETGRATGVVTSVQFSHATPASWGAHNADRWAQHAISDEMINGPLDVIVGTGHPLYDDDNELLGAPVYDYLTENTWNRLQDGQTKFDLVQTTDEFQALADGENLPEQYFGLIQVRTTLQQGRSGDFSDALPFEVPLNDVPDLATLSQGAINVLDQNEEGFFLMIEGGAIDWTGHANQTVRNIEETVDFNRAVEAVVEWVEAESSWEETLVIVTADHETGYLAGPNTGGETWDPITGARGQVPNVGWYSGSHTNQLVPLYANGPGSEILASWATGVDPVRGAYLDNTDVGQLAFELWGYQDGPDEEGIPLVAEVPDSTEEPGRLVLTVADFGNGVALEGPEHGGDRLQFTGALPTVTVTDSRNDDTAAGGGWAVTGQSGDFTTNGQLIRSRHLGWTPQLITERAGVTPGEQVLSHLSGGPGLAVPASLATADADGRAGSTEIGADLLLEVPVDTRAGEYVGHLTVSLFPTD